ncbi:MAG: hypothetical protein NXI27_29335 [Alphaproteobacteria bacterium]|nr:hypothetical protein [Alphaproteobacteria bacterium]
MPGNLIDASRRFSSSNQESSDEEKQRAAEAFRQQRRVDAANLEDTLRNTKTLAKEDRITIARNLGRLLERGFKGEERAAATKLYSIAYGEDGGRSLDKKRKRTIRFSDDSVSPDETYTAHGSTFLKLIYAYADLKFRHAASDDERANVLLEALNGTTLTQHSGPKLAARGDPRQTFERLANQILDSLATTTDLVPYLEEISKRHFHLVPSHVGEMTEEELANIHLKSPSIRAIEPVPENNRTRSSETPLNGFRDVASVLFPEIPIARIYMPRTVLCFDALLTEDEANAFNYRDAETPENIAAAKALYIEKYGELPDFVDDVDRYVYDDWRGSKELQAFERVVERSGYKFEEIDWTNLEDSHTKEAPPGSHWRIYWQAHTLKLIIRADGAAENLRLGLLVEDPIFGNDGRELTDPKYDDDATRWISVKNLELQDDYGLPWYPVSDGFHACRGHKITLPVGPTGVYEPEPVFGELRSTGKEIDIDAEWHPMIQALEFDTGVEITSDPGWNLFSMKTIDWERSHTFNRGPGYREYPQLPNPGIRLLFDVPDGYATMPDDTLASAIVRNLAYAVGATRLDEMLKYAVSERVAKLTESREKAERKLQQALKEHGYEL